MDYVTIKGYIKDGHLRVDLPENVADGEVTVQIPIQADVPWDERPWTEAELQQFMQFQPTPASQIETGGWEELEISDTAAWLAEQKHRRKASQKW